MDYQLYVGAERIRGGGLLTLRGKLNLSSSPDLGEPKSWAGIVLFDVWIVDGCIDFQVD
jgi:hypothetical protein